VCCYAKLVDVPGPKRFDARNGDVLRSTPCFCTKSVVSLSLPSVAVPKSDVFRPIKFYCTNR
jgi:hypothetical protein